MKRVGFLLIGFACWRASGQGEIAFYNRPDSLVTNACLGQLVPQGSDLVVGLYMAEFGQFDERRFKLLATTTRWIRPGWFHGGTVKVPLTYGAGPRQFQVRVWEGDFGASFEEAAVAPPRAGRRSLLGKSEVVFGYLSIPPGPPGPLYLNPFCIGLPECALGGVWFENDASTVITNLCTASPVLPDGGLIAGLYYAPDGVSNPSAFTLLSEPVPFSRRAGEFHGGPRLLPAATPPGSFARLQVRVWESAFGSTYEEAVTAPPERGRRSLIGTSAVMRVLNPPPGTSLAYLPSNGLGRVVVGFPECLVGGAVLFQNGSAARITNLCSGEPIVAGTNFSAALYYAPFGKTNAARLRRLGPTVNFGPLPGEVFGGVRVTPSATRPGEVATFQIRVWETSYGATFEAAAAAPPRDGRRALLGQSALFTAPTSLENTAAPLSSAGTLSGFYVGHPECVVPGSVAFQNSPATLVTNLETGSPVQPGSTFLAALYAAPDGETNEARFVPLGPAVPFGPEPGRFLGGNRVATEVALAGEPAMFQVRVWESAFGSSYEQALAAPPQQGRPAIVGKSGIVRVPTMGEGFPLQPPPALAAYGLTSIFLARLGTFTSGTVLFRTDPRLPIFNSCTGEPIPAGNAFLAALYYAPEGTTDPRAFVQLGPSIGFGPESGQIMGGPRTVPTNTMAGETAWFFVRVWEAAYGRTYEEAIAAASHHNQPPLTGQSDIVRTRTWATNGSSAPDAVPILNLVIGRPFEALDLQESPSQIYNGCTFQLVPPDLTYRTALYYAPAGITNDSQFISLATSEIGPVPGQVHWGRLSLPDRLYPGEAAQFQIRVWETLFGRTFEEAIAAPPIHGRAAFTGKSQIVQFAPPPQCDLVGKVLSLYKLGLSRVWLNESNCPDQRLRFAANLSICCIGWVSAAVGDLTGDGWPDALMHRWFTGNLLMLTNNGQGILTLVPAQTLTFAPSTIALGDLDRDGRADLVTGDTAPVGISVFPGNGDGTFGLPRTYAVSSPPNWIVVGDFNGDSTLDLLTGNHSQRFLELFDGRGDGLFHPSRRISLDFTPSALTGADFNGDCLLDIVAGGEEAWTLVMLRNEGLHGFSFERMQLTSQRIGGLAAGDFNGDHHTDLVVANSWPEPLSGALLNDFFSATVFLGGPDASFTPVASYIVGGFSWLNPPPYSHSAGVADFNGDGRPDILVLNPYGALLSVLLNETEFLVLRDDSAETLRNTPVVLNLLANDGHEGTWLSLADLTTPAHGQATILDGTNVLYVPNPEFVGIDKFTYSIYGCDDGTGDTAEVTVNVVSSNRSNPSPRVRITQSDTGFILHWPAEAGQFTVEMSTNLTAPVRWTPVSATPVLISGEWTVGFPASGRDHSFFRLRAP